MNRVEPRPRAERSPMPAARAPCRPFAAVLREASRRPASARQAKATGEAARAADERAAAAWAAPPEDRASLAIAGPGDAASLRAIVRTLPVALAALSSGGWGPRLSEGLALDLGRTLSVELRPSAAGLELVLRPAQEVARVASAELPALVRTLRERGVRVSAASVRPRGAADSVRREPRPSSP